MWIIGCDFHPRYQQIAALNLDTDELVERRLSHEGKETAAFYEALPRGALIGMEATCTAQWFERFAGALRTYFAGGRCGSDSRFGSAQAKNRYPRCLHILDLLLTDRFPSVWIPTPAERDARSCCCIGTR